MDGLLAKLSKGYKIASPGAGVAVLSFFLPWFLVSCGGMEVSMSGWDLAAGKTINMGFTAQRVPASPIVFLVLLAGVAIIALAYLSARREALVKFIDGMGVALLSGVGLLVTLLVLTNLEQQAAEQGLSAFVSYQIGLWGVLLGYAASLVGGVMNIAEKQHPASRSDFAPFPSASVENPMTTTEQHNQ